MARVRQIAASARQAELEELFRTRVISGPVYGKLRQELDSRIAALQAQVAEMYGRDSSRAEAEMQTARLRLAAAEKSAIEAAVHAGLITKLLDSVDQRVADTAQPQGEEPPEASAQSS